MKNYQSLLLLLSSVFVSGCAALSSNPHPGKLERVGVLLVGKCATSPVSTACERFSLLDQDMQTPLATLSGNIDASLAGRLVAVLGEEQPGNRGVPGIDVEQSKSITDFDFRLFIGRAVRDYTQENYGCASLWDQGYAWRLDGRQPVLISTLQHPSADNASNVTLEFDGLSKELLSAQSSPQDANPCQLNE